jgi:hypothetical protein
MALLLYSRSVPDAIASALIRAARPGVSFMALEDVVSQARINLRVNGGHELVGAHEFLDAIAAEKFLINRAFIGKDTLESSSQAERPSQLALQTEIESALVAAISGSRKATARPGLYSLCGDNLPLYLQWSRIRSECPDFNTPNYTYAFGSLAPEVEQFKNVIYKSAYDHKTWKPNSPPALWWHTFAVDRPDGTPVVASVIGDDAVVVGDVAEPVICSIRKQSISMARLFGSEFGEILFFVEGSEVCFGAFTHQVTGREASERVDALVNDWVVEKLEMERCSSA